MIKYILVHIIDQDILKESANIFDSKGSKKNTLINCSVIAVAKKIKADGIFFFDSFYTKQGLELVENLIK